MQLEICANSYQSAINAEEGGANQIELCSALSIGGITPSFGLLEMVLRKVQIPVHVLIRPRGGNFCYTDAEFEIMITDIKICKKLGAAAIVSGVLKEDLTLDIERTEQLILAAKPLSFIFHRAFDCVPNPASTLKTLIDLDVNAVLTSGQAEKAISGIELLKKLNKQTKGLIQIMPGGGVNENNVLHFKQAGFKVVHASATKPLVRKIKSPFFDEDLILESDLATIKKLVALVKG